MPLMQLSTLVLPAPFGPINASSSCRSTAKVTRSRTTRPPNCKCKCSIASSAIPPATPAILFDHAVAPTLTLRRLAEIELLNVFVRAQARAVAVQNATAVLQHIAIVGDDRKSVV